MEKTMTAKEYYNSTRLVETRHWTLEMAMAFAEEYHKNAIQVPESNESEVSLVSLHGHWHLHRVVNGKHYFGFSDHRLGLSIRTETPDKIKDLKPRDFKMLCSFIASDGDLIEYLDEPYTESQIKSFGNLTVEQLDEWVKRGN
jgi:hypothetical protein